MEVAKQKKMSDSSLLWYISDATDSTNVIVLWIGKIIIHWVLVILNNRPVVLRRNIFQPDTNRSEKQQYNGAKLYAKG